jgi:nucleotide-binding universal stress UspA family protein
MFGQHRCLDAVRVSRPAVCTRLTGKSGSGVSGSGSKRVSVVIVGRVIAGVSGSPASLQALRYAADVAGTHEALLLPVHAWLPPGGDLADRRFPCEQLRQAWTQAAWQRLGEAIDLSLGGPPAWLDCQPTIGRGDAGKVLVQLATEPGDLLVIGAGRRGLFARIGGGHASRYCLAHARCPVVALPPPALAEVAHGMRGWAWRRRNVDPQDVHLHGAGA